MWEGAHMGSCAADAANGHCSRLLLGMLQFMPKLALYSMCEIKLKQENTCFFLVFCGCKRMRFVQVCAK